MKQKITLGISACLLGDAVRYNGGHKRSDLCLEELGGVFNYQKFCPEMAADMGVPRPSMRLEGEVSKPDLVFSSGRQREQFPGRLNARLEAGFTQQLEQLDALDGYILMQKSPSCGLSQLKVYQGENQYTERGRGLFAAALIKHKPCLPVAEEVSLHQPRVLENFVVRVMVHHRFRQQLTGQSVGQLIKFHRRHKYLLMAHDVNAYKNLAKDLNQSESKNFTQLRQEYFKGIMLALAQVASREDHANALRQWLGDLKTAFTISQRQDLKSAIQQYSAAEISLARVMVLLKNNAAGVDAELITQQLYLQPYPAALGLRDNI